MRTNSKILAQYVICFFQANLTYDVKVVEIETESESLLPDHHSHIERELSVVPNVLRYPVHEHGLY